MKDEYHHVDIGPQLGLKAKVLVSVSKDPMALVNELFANPQGRAALWPKLIMDQDGQRVYSDMWTANKWMYDQVCVNLKHLPSAKEFVPQVSSITRAAHLGQGLPDCVHHHLVG